MLGLQVDCGRRWQERFRARCKQLNEKRRAEEDVVVWTGVQTRQKRERGANEAPGRRESFYFICWAELGCSRGGVGGAIKARGVTLYALRGDEPVEMPMAQSLTASTFSLVSASRFGRQLDETGAIGILLYFFVFSPPLPIALILL